MYKIIVAPNDGSPNAFVALTRAARLAKHYASELRIVRVSNPTILIQPFGEAVDAELQQKAIDDQVDADMRELDALARKCRHMGALSVCPVLLKGSPGPALKDYVVQSDVDLIVISSHSRGEVSRIALGSVTDYLIRNTEVPVLIVKEPAAIVAPDEVMVRRIVVPLDGSHLAEQVLRQVAAMTTNGITTVNLVQVLVPSTYSQKRIMDSALPWWENEFTDSDGYLEHTAAYLRHDGISVVTDVILAEDVASAILKHAVQYRADMIAIASSGTGGLKRLMFGSVADEVARKSPVSVLVFHPQIAKAPQTPKVSEEADICSAR